MRLGMRHGMYVLAAIVFSGLLLMMGCGGGGDSSIFLNVSERASWGGAGAIALTSWGANEIRYVYSVGETGGGPKLLTWSDNDDDWSDEGGAHPAYRPDDSQAIAIAARRGSKDGIYQIDANDGDRQQAATLITEPPGNGADSMPSWSPDSSTLVFVTTQYNGTMDLATVAADGTGRASLVEDADADLMWPAYTPDGGAIIYERRAKGENRSDIYICDAATGAPLPLLAPLAPGDPDFDDRAPAVSPDGTTILFHSNRSGPKYDIWAFDMDAATLTLTPGSERAITQTSRSDGYPTWAPDGMHVAFVRDRELWTMLWTDVEDDRDYRRLTRRYR